MTHIPSADPARSSGSESPVALAAAPAAVDVSAIDRHERAVARTEPAVRTPAQALAQAAIYALLVFLTVLFIAPFIWLISNSLKDIATVFDAELIPTPPRWSNYATVWTDLNFLTLTRNSAIVAVLGVLGTILSSSLIGFGLARLRFPGRNLVFTLVLATMLLPAAVTMVPVFLIWNEVRKFTSELTGGAFVIGVNTLWPLFLGNFFGSSFYIFMLRQFFLGIPQEIIEAARVDGAGYFRIWWQLMLPLVKPAILAVTVLEFQSKWNDFLGPLIYVNPRAELHTLPLGLWKYSVQQGFGQFHWELLFAGTVMFTIPMVVIFFLAQKQFIQGIATTGLKG